jgi:hypothetical protein
VSSMNGDISLAEQRHCLRRQLQAQRQVIAQQLGPAESAMNDSYPRSRTMRFLTQHPTPIIRLLLGVVTLLRAR